MPSQNSMVYLSDKDTSKSVGDRSVDTDQIEFDTVWCQVVDGDFEVLLDIAVVNSLVEGTYKVWYILAWILPNPKHYWFPGTGEDNRCHSPMIYKFEPCRLNSNVIQRTLYTRSRSTMTRVRSSSTFSGNWTPGMLLVQEKKSEFCGCRPSKNPPSDSAEFLPEWHSNTTYLTYATWRERQRHLRQAQLPL